MLPNYDSGYINSETQHDKLNYCCRLYEKYAGLLSGEANREKEAFLNQKGAPLMAYKERMDG